MSEIIMCDGPECASTRSTELITIGDPGWLTMSRAFTSDRHYCSPRCAVHAMGGTWPDDQRDAEAPPKDGA